MASNKTDLVDRAVVAYRRRIASADQLGGYTTEIDGRLYAVVHVQGACRAAYLVRKDGRLRRLRQWPSLIW